MWTQTHSALYKNLNKDNLWRLWTDVNNWPTWHTDLEYCTMDSAFEVGNHFMLKPKGAPAVKIVLTEITPGYKFTDCTIFFGAKMYDTHIIEETNDGILLTNTLVVTGPLSWLWVKLVAQNIAKTVPADMDTLANIARKMTSTPSGTNHD